MPSALLSTLPGSDSTGNSSEPFDVARSVPSGVCGLIATSATPRSRRVGSSSCWYVFSVRLQYGHQAPR